MDTAVGGLDATTLIDRLYSNNQQLVIESLRIIRSLDEQQRNKGVLAAVKTEVVKDGSVPLWKSISQQDLESPEIGIPLIAYCIKNGPSQLLAKGLASVANLNDKDLDHLAILLS